MVGPTIRVALFTDAGVSPGERAKVTVQLIPSMGTRNRALFQ
jgi:hypothetical protein